MTAANHPYTESGFGDYITRGIWEDRPMSLADATDAVLEFATGLGRIHPELAPHWADDYHRLPGESRVELTADWVSRDLEASHHRARAEPEWTDPPATASTGPHPGANSS